MKDLAGRLKEAEARLPAALTTAYRHVLVPDKNKTIRCIDMGISVGKATLSQKVLDKLKDEQQILDKLDPAILIGERFGLWPQDQEMVNVRTLADYFTQLTHLPMLLDAGVLPDCFAKGVQRGLFAYALGDGEKKQFDTILFNDKNMTADRVRDHRVGMAAATRARQVADARTRAGRHWQDGWRCRFDRHGSRQARIRPTGQAASWTAVKGGGAKIVKGERRLNKVRIDMTTSRGTSGTTSTTRSSTRWPRKARTSYAR